MGADMIFATRPAATYAVATEWMRLSSNGSLGIGTTTLPAKLNVSGNIAASSAIARGVFFNNTLVAAANSDVLVGLDINPTFTNGAFTGVTNLALRVTGNASITGNTTITGNNTIVGLISNTVPLNSTTRIASPVSNTTGAVNTIDFDLLNSSHRFSIIRNNFGNRNVVQFTDTNLYFSRGNLDTNGGGINRFEDGSNISTQIYSNNAGTRLGQIRFDVGGGGTSYIFSTNNFGINTATDAGFRLDVNGTARVQGVLTQTYSDNAYGAGITINNTNTGVQALAGVQFTTNSVVGGFMAYIPSNYSLVAQRSTMQFTSTGNYNLVFIANSNSSGVAQDIYFSTFGSNVTYQMQVKANGNVLINTNTDVASSKLTIDSTTQGFLPPRMTEAQRTAIASPATGLIVFQTDGVEGLWLRVSTGWVELTVV
jgi:hypothetical protein